MIARLEAAWIMVHHGFPLRLGDRVLPQIKRLADGDPVGGLFPIFRIWICVWGPHHECTSGHTNKLHADAVGPSFAIHIRYLRLSGEGHFAFQLGFASRAMNLLCRRIAYLPARCVTESAKVFRPFFLSKTGILR